MLAYTESYRYTGSDDCSKTDFLPLCQYLLATTLLGDGGGGSDREQIVPSSQLLRSAAVPSKVDIVKLTGKDTVEGITDDVNDKSLYAS